MSDVQVRAIGEGDLPEADRIFRLAFGTFLRLPDPLAFGGDAAFVRARGYRTVIQGVAMHRPNQPAYSRPDVLAIDDWR